MDIYNIVKLSNYMVVFGDVIDAVICIYATRT